MQNTKQVSSVVMVARWTRHQASCQKSASSMSRVFLYDLINDADRKNKFLRDL